MAQLGIAFGALGIVLALMGLFPGVTGIAPGRGVGLVQTAAILIGFSLLHLGALVYVKTTLYAGRPSTLGQQIGVRLTLTGLLFAAITGLADFLGFGSHAPLEGREVFFGGLQAAGVLGGLLLAALGVFLFALNGKPPDDDDIVKPP